MSLIKCKECNHDISKKAKKCPNCGAPNKKKTSVFTWLLIIIISIWFIGLFSSAPTSTRSKTSSTPSKSIELKQSTKEIAMDNIKLTFTWKKSGFDNIMEANFIISNSSGYEVKDVEIACTHYAKSGTKIDSNKRTIFDIIPPNQSKQFNKFNMGFIHSQAEKTSCQITDLKTM